MHLKALFGEKVHSVHMPIHKNTHSKASLSRIKCRLSCYLLLSFFFLLTQHFLFTVLFPASLLSQEREAGRQEKVSLLISPVLFLPAALSPGR